MKKYLLFFDGVDCMELAQDYWHVVNMVKELGCGIS
jgi:hypothetical protein